MIQLLINKDMPSSCRECFRNRQCPQWNRRSLWKEEYIYKRSDNCPLHEIKPQEDKESEVLDKIRAEIESIEHYGTNNGHDFWLRTPNEIKKDVLTILDKYKAEVEPQESEVEDGKDS